jgi:hypothetical protein
MKPMAGEPKNPLMLWAGLAFAIFLAAWATFFVIASKHPAEEVPLQTQPKQAH